MPGSKAVKYRSFCLISDDPNVPIFYAGPFNVREGETLPAPAPGLTYKEVPPTYNCTAAACTGPLAPWLRKFFSLLPASWKPTPPAAPTFADRLAASAKRRASRAAFLSRQQEARFRGAAPEGAPIAPTRRGWALIGKDGQTVTVGLGEDPAVVFASTMQYRSDLAPFTFRDLGAS